MAKDPNKWAFMRVLKKPDGSPRYPHLPLDPTYDDVKETLYREMEGQQTVRIAERWNRAEEAKAEIVKALAEQDAIITVCERMVYSRMEAEEQEMVILDGMRFKRREEPVAKVEDKVAYLTWVGKEMPDILSVHYQTTQALVKLELEKPGGAGVIPPGIDVSTRPIVNRTHA